MIDDEFEWDDAKAAVNLAKHGVSFEVACSVFDDPLAIEGEDETSTGEVRINIVGEVGGRLLHVTYTDRQDRIRIISARKATGYDKKRYTRGYF